MSAALYDVRLRIAAWYDLGEITAAGAAAATGKAEKTLMRSMRASLEVGHAPSPADIDFDYPWGATVVKRREDGRATSVRSYTFMDDAWVVLDEPRRKPKPRGAAPMARRSSRKVLLREADAEFERALDRRYRPGSR